MDEADQSVLTPETDHRRIEFLLKLTSDRVNGLEGALERNWIAHLILAGIGVALVFHIGRFRELLANYFVRGPYDQTAVATVVLALLLYYFMKLGHLLTLYVKANGLHQQLLKDYLGDRFDSAKTVLGTSTNFYVEAFFSVKPFSPGETFGPYRLVTIVVVSLAQAAALFLVTQAYGLSRWFPCVVLVTGACTISCYLFFKTGRRPRFATVLAAILLLIVLAITVTVSVKSGWPSLILLFAGAVIVTLYLLFWSSNRGLPETNLAVVSSPALAAVWLIIFAVISR